MKDYKHNAPLPKVVRNAIRPVYKDLSADELLKRCEGGYTQNNNESLNSMIWSIAPKTQFCGKRTVDIAAFIATNVFNDGFNSILLMMQMMELNIGQECYNLCQKIDATRLSKAEVKTYESSKLVRQLLREAHKEINEEHSNAEGVLYGPGIAD